MRADLDIDIAFFCDGFMINKKETFAGCSVGKVVKEKPMWVQKYYIKDCKNSALRKYLMSLPPTNNVSEYFAVLCALNCAKGTNGAYVYSDSELIVNQVNDICAVSEKFEPLRNICQTMMEKNNTRVLWVSRIANVKLLGH